MSLRPPSGIRVLIVGAGFGGLATAIECVRKGHDVMVLEAVPDLKPLGDIISLASNAGRLIARWPGVQQELDKICHHSDRFHLRLYNGEHLLTQIWEDRGWGPKFNGHRAELHEVFLRHAKAIGADVRMGMKVEKYFETHTEAGVVVNGERITGDVVIGADGLHSIARSFVVGFESKPKPSGYSVWRSWFAADEIAKHPLTKFMVENGDYHIGWLGPDVHFLAASVKNGKDFCWVCTRKDEAKGNSEEKSVITKTLEGYDPVVHKVIKLTPPDRIFDWNLVLHDPLPTWISRKGRVALAGDAAHSFLPTSIQGASQAIEDGATIAACLELAGNDGAPLALRAYEKIRYDRVRAAQETGVSTRDRWHKADFANAVRKNPDMIKLPRHEWLLNFDAEAHAYAVYPRVVSVLLDRAKL